MKRSRAEPSSSSSGFGPKGLHQKMQLQMAVMNTGEPEGQSHLARLLINEWAWGNLSSPVFQKIASAAEADGATHKDVKTLASLGAHGLYPGNTHRDLLRKLATPIVPSALMDYTMWIKLPFLKTAQVNQKILLPHALFSHIYTHDQGLFEEVFMGGDKKRVSEFWDQIGTTERYHTTHIKIKPNHKTHCIPLGLHGDGVTVTGVGRSWGKQADAYSWTSLLASGPAKSVNFLVWACYQQCISVADDKATMDQFWDLLTWSFGCLERGQWPSRDMHGAEISGGPRGPLAGGYFATLWTLKGDLDYFSKCIKLESAQSKTPCFLCKCNQSTIPWTAVDPATAEWMNNIWAGDEDWVAAHLSIPSIFDLPDVGLHSVSPDWMHTKHLGTDQYLYGSVLMLLTHTIDGSRMMPATPSQNLAALWAEMKPACRSSFSDLRLSMFVPAAEHFPVLKGRAAEIRHFGTPLLHAWEKYMNKANRQHRQIRLALQASVTLEQILDANEDRFVLAGDSAVAFRKGCFDLATLISGLSQFFHGRGIFLFHFTIKTHYLLHFGLSCTEFSPRVGWCYSGEDMMGRIKVLVQGSCRGAAPQRLMSKVLTKYSVGLSYQLMTPTRWWV